MRWNKTVIRCAVFGGIVAFVWGMFSWMVLPFHKMSMHTFRNEQQVAQAIMQNAPESGMYMMPSCTKKEMGEPKGAMHERMKTGPVMSASIVLEGMDPSSMTPYVISLIIQIVGAYFITCLLLKCKSMPYMEQVFFVTLVGLVVGILGVLPGWNWMGYSCGFAITMIVDLVIAWFLAGLVIAKFAHPHKH